MDKRPIEPYKPMWGVAEVAWEDDSGTSFRAPATLEGTSPSGACVRVQRPFNVGSRIAIRWHREQFSAIARNCRSDGTAFILGLLREPGNSGNITTQMKPAKHLRRLNSRRRNRPSHLLRPKQILSNPQELKPARKMAPRLRASAKAPSPHRRPPGHHQKIPVRPFIPRKVMQPKALFPQFWRRQQDGDAPAKSTSTEAPVNKPRPRHRRAANHAAICCLTRISTAPPAS
jgi:hypothetical protein